MLSSTEESFNPIDHYDGFYKFKGGMSALVHKFRAPLVMVACAVVSVALGRRHLVKRFSYFAVFPTEEDFA